MGIWESNDHNCKVQLFREDLKNLRNLPHGFDIYLVNVKTMRKIAQIFEVFSEKLNFKDLVKTQGDEKRKILL